MAVEIERKFLVKGQEWREETTGLIYRQGYIYTQNSITVRVRLAGEQGYLTIKGKSIGSSRSEYEYPIPATDAQEMLNTLCDRPLIEKKRYKLKQGDLTWEIDEFFGENEGLIIAEVELITEDQTVNLPPWIGDEVTHDSRYFNINLAKHPYRNWQES